MDDDIVLVIILICLGLVVIGILVYAIADINFKAEAAEKAQQICEQKGYDTYDTFNRKIFGTIPYGVKCNYIQNRRELITNSDTVVAVANS